AGGTLVSIVGPTEARPADGLTVDFVVESDRAQLSEIVQRARDGRLRTNIGNIATLDDAVAALNPTERRKGKTIIRVRPRRTRAHWCTQPAGAVQVGRLLPISRSHREAAMAFMLKINGTPHEVDVDGDTPLLWVLRDVLGMTGTKFGCGQALCGACTVHVDGAATRTCITMVDSIGESAITTIEAIGQTPQGAALQKAWLELEVVQCGYCQSGQIMSAAARPEGL